MLENFPTLSLMRW